MASEKLPVQLACRVLGVAESGYYDWRSRPPSARSLRHAWLTEQIQAVHQASLGTYGSRRVHAELRLGLGIVVGHGAVEMLMRRAGLVGLPGRKRRRPVHDTAFPGDLVDRNFARDRPNELWSPTSPSTPPARARSTAQSCWTCIPAESWAGRSTPARPPRWPPTRSAWPSPTAAQAATAPP
jgi:hypothetical protein